MSYIPIKIRNFNPDKDFPTHTELLNASAKADGSEETTIEAQKDYVSLFNIDLSTERFVVENPEDSSQLIAICDCWQIGGNPSCDLFLLVHPDWRRKGIGTVLFQRAKSHAKSINATAIDGYATPEQIGIQSFLQKHKFTIAGNFTAMHLSQQSDFPKAQLPNGYTIQNYTELEATELEKLKLILKASREFWGVLWGHKVGPDNETALQELKEHINTEFPTDLIFFLFDEKNMFIGHDRVSFTESTEAPITKTASVGPPAIHPDYHTPELVTQFTLVELNKLFEKGCREFNLESWGENDATIQAFESLGFKTTFFELGYQLKLS